MNDRKDAPLRLLNYAQIDKEEHTAEIIIRRYLIKRTYQDNITPLPGPDRTMEQERRIPPVLCRRQ